MKKPDGHRKFGSARPQVWDYWVRILVHARS